MGFLDKAKKMAEQAQAKLDEVQGQFNAGQPGHQGGGPVTEYDKHGRPVDARCAAAPVSTRAARGRRPPASRRPSLRSRLRRPPGRLPIPSAPVTPGTPPSEDPNRAPKLSSGDPLAGLTLRSCGSCAPTKACSLRWSRRSARTARSTRRRPSSIGRHLLQHGSDGLVIAGTTGEAATMTDEEQVELVRLLASELGSEGADGRPARAPTTRATPIHLTEAVIEAGAHAVLSVTPYYNKPNRARDHRATSRRSRARPAARR